MRKVTVKQSDTGKERDINICSLKRKEIKELSDYGYTYLGCVPTLETAQDTVDKGLGYVLSEEDQAFLDECDNSEFKRLWNELLKETYGDPKAEKN